ncbi:unnamed protein product [Gordionus sp. m RMFG-2023]
MRRRFSSSDEQETENTDPESFYLTKDAKIPDKNTHPKVTNLNLSGSDSVSNSINNSNYHSPPVDYSDSSGYSDKEIKSKISQSSNKNARIPTLSRPKEKYPPNILTKDRTPSYLSSQEEKMESDNSNNIAYLTPGEESRSLKNKTISPPKRQLTKDVANTEHTSEYGSPPSKNPPINVSVDSRNEEVIKMKQGPDGRINRMDAPVGRKRYHVRSQSQTASPSTPDSNIAPLTQKNSNTFFDNCSIDQQPSRASGDSGRSFSSNFAENLKGLFSGSLSNLSNAAQSLVASATPTSMINPSFYHQQNFIGSLGSSQRRSSGSVVNYNRRGSSKVFDKYKTLLVIDERHTDWSKYFKGKTLNDEWEIRLEQAEFKEINVAAYTDTGTVVDMQLMKGGTKVIRSFKPDFILIRQYVKDVRDDWKNILLGFMYGNVPTLNSLESIYNFHDKPKIFSELIQIQQKLGKEQFPLIEQAYYPNYKEMVI